jgi:manganese transport protein
VVLGLQLPFVMMPLLRFAASKKLMGDFALKAPWQLVGWLLFALIAGANLWLIWQLMA